MERAEVAKKLFDLAIRFIRQQSFNNIVLKEVHLNEKLRVDLFWLNWKDRITIFEVKTCRADFSGDTKWKNYMDYCHHLFFICPEGVINKDELPKEVGLIYMIGNRLQVVQKPLELRPRKVNNAWLRYVYKKMAFRRFAKFHGEPISLDQENIFTNE